LPQNLVSSVAYRLFDKRRLAGDAVDAAGQESRVIVHRRQAASHSPVLLRDSATSKTWWRLPQIGERSEGMTTLQP
ncbi:hypothetical protein, partial [Pseudomonas viridiflava]